MLQLIVGILLVSAVVVFIVLDRRKIAKKQNHFENHSDRSLNKEKERSEKLSEHQKGSGRAGGFDP